MNEPEFEPYDTRVLRMAGGVRTPTGAPAGLSAEAIRGGGATGTRLLGYDLGELVGSGGMGTVYKANHRWLGRAVAIKFIAPAALADDEVAARFECEARAVGALDHPQIVRATDAGRCAGLCFLVTEFIEGEDVARLVRRRGPLSPADACRIVVAAAAGLQHAHEQGLVHRDVKPSNLIVDKQGVTKLIDFGIARLAVGPTTLTNTGQMLGTLDFLAPEQASDAHQIDIRADIYSLGCTLYFLLSGEPPFAGPRYQTPAAKLKGHLVDAPPALIGARWPVPRGVLECLERMMAKPADERYDTPGEIAEALEPFARGARLDLLVSDDLCYGISGRKHVAVEPSWWQAPWHHLTAAFQSVYPSGTKSAARERRQPLAWAAACVVTATLSCVLFLKYYQHRGVPWAPGHSETAVRARELPTLPQASSSAPLPSAVNVERAPTVTTSASDETKVAMPAKKPKKSQRTAPKASAQAPATPYGTPGAMPNRTFTATGKPKEGRLPGPGPDAGFEYQFIRQHGTPPPGFDPTKMPPGFDGAEMPAGLRDGMLPFNFPDPFNPSCPPGR